ncbi:MAG: quinol:cytochrome C oxidoreductase [Bacteroidia bacterium]|jgi:hypothetical protein|nr:quinol:cytochrome C oxidoreductase [Bacteroidia bacterium]
MGHATAVQIKEEKFILSDKAKKLTFGLMGLGALLVIVGYLTYHPTITGLTEEQVHHLPLKRLLGSMLFNGYFFFIIATCAAVFIAISQLANAGWYVAIRRIPEAMSEFMIYGAVIILIAVGLGLPIIYHWAHDGVMEMDELLAKKTWYLNKPFFLIRLVLFMGFWIWAASMIRKYSRQEDQLSKGLNDTTFFDKTFKLSAVFMFIFAFTFSMFAWDVTMSIDAHWYSTIFTIYNFATGWVSALTTIYLITWFLRSNGYLNIVTDEHQHDLGKFMFAFSVFWTYMWVAQFLLIWYANIPEEVAYYKDRLQGSYKFSFFFNVIMNFVVPFFLFMRRGAKRSRTMGAIVGACILLGHWNDVYLMVMPGAMNLATEVTGENPVGIISVDSQGVGFMELGFLFLFGGLFLFIVLKALTKANLYPTKHPFIMESALHDTGV